MSHTQMAAVLLAVATLEPWRPFCLCLREALCLRNAFGGHPSSLMTWFVLFGLLSCLSWPWGQRVWEAFALRLPLGPQKCRCTRMRELRRDAALLGPSTELRDLGD